MCCLNQPSYKQLCHPIPSPVIDELEGGGGEICVQDPFFGLKPKWQTNSIVRVTRTWYCIAQTLADNYVTLAVVVRYNGTDCIRQLRNICSVCVFCWPTASDNYVTLAVVVCDVGTDCRRQLRNISSGCVL